MARKELGCTKKISCETGIIPVLQSVANIRLVKTDYIGVCVTVDCRVCGSAIAVNQYNHPIHNPSNSHNP
jgi:hypothetical protein